MRGCCCRLPGRIFCPDLTVCIHVHLYGWASASESAAAIYDGVDAKTEATAPTLIDLFAGCGGMTAGFVEHGFNPTMAVEHWLPAAATYAANFGEHHCRLIDIVDLATADVLEADVVVGGPPCQGFSTLGKKDPCDPRNRLWEEYVRVVLAANPKVFVVENVAQFANSREFQALIGELTGGALCKWRHHDWAILNAADYGVPQRRKRMILIASRVGPMPLPERTHTKSGGRGLAPWATVRDAIGDIDPEPVGIALPARKASFFGASVRGVFASSEIHLGRHHTQMSLDRYDHVPPGGGRFDLPAELTPGYLLRRPTGFTDVIGRMRWDAPSLTIRTEFHKPSKGRYLHPQWDDWQRVNRPITHLEAARLQTFSDDFVWCGSKMAIARQIGNAVPPRLAAAIAEAIRERL